MSARKTCTRCRQTKGVGEFSKDQSKSDGLRPDCKTCRREYDARYYEENRERRREYNARYRAENRERYREYAARWREENRDNPEYRERARERSARWYAENRERKREYDARWYEENRERIREYDARYHEENPEISRARSARRRARKRGLPDDGSGIADWLSHMEDSDVWHCHLCGGAFAAEDEIHWDHRDPVSTGTAGTVLSNMAAAHDTCNISRGNTPLREWHKRVGLPDGVV